MSGIIGLWNFDGAPVERALVERLAAGLHHRGPDATGIWTEGGAGMAACLLRVAPESQAEIQPLVAINRHQFETAVRRSSRRIVSSAALWRILV
jgi:asparagine synthase (glutamine-hydrolysing)